MTRTHRTVTIIVAHRRGGHPWPDRQERRGNGATVDMLVRRLLSQAHLFDDPAAYEAGVRDALAVLVEERHLPGSAVTADDASPRGHAAA